MRGSNTAVGELGLCQTLGATGTVIGQGFSLNVGQIPVELFSAGNMGKRLRAPLSRDKLENSPIQLILT